MVISKTKILSKKQKIEINNLWNNEYPIKLNYSKLDEFETYLSNLKDQNHLLLSDKNGLIKGWCVCFTRENERWFAMILDSQFQGKGYGSQLLDITKKEENELNGWVIDHNKDIKKNGKTYLHPIEFYFKNDFTLLSEKRLELDKISAVKIKWMKEQKQFTFN